MSVKDFVMSGLIIKFASKKNRIIVKNEKYKIKDIEKEFDETGAGSACRCLLVTGVSAE